MSGSLPEPALLLAALAFLSLWIGLRHMAAARRAVHATGLAGLRVRHADIEGRRPRRTMRCTRYGLVGRPDFLLEESGAIVPVEVKPSRHARRPYRGDVLQLAAYCLLVEAETGRPPPYGVLVYADRRWELAWDRGRRREVVQALDELRQARAARDVGRSHDVAVRCVACGVRAECGQALPRD